MPFWHKVTKDDVIHYSPPLADVFAADTSSATTEEIALAILDRVRPDLRDSYVSRRAMHDVRDQLQTEPLSELVWGPIRYSGLPREVRNRIRIIHEVFSDILTVSYEDTELGFRRDKDPETEIQIWESIAAAFLNAGGKQLEPEQGRILFQTLLLRSMGMIDAVAESLIRLPEEVVSKTLDAIQIMTTP